MKTLNVVIAHVKQMNLEIKMETASLVQAVLIMKYLMQKNAISVMRLNQHAIWFQTQIYAEKNVKLVTTETAQEIV
jgi:hypothetical protein